MAPITTVAVSVAALSLGCALTLSSHSASAFAPPSPLSRSTTTSSVTCSGHWANRLDERFDGDDSDSDSDKSRRLLLIKGTLSATLAVFGTAASTSPVLSSLLLGVPPANADFAPGGTFLDRPVGVTIGNPEASPSRLPNNSNVLFSQDNYFKFGSAAQWIDPTAENWRDFPVKVPFIMSQQRYDAMKKYGPRVESFKEQVAAIDAALRDSDGDRKARIPEPDSPIYSLRALGLLANNFLASENTGTTNELMLARWYVNEIYLRIGDVRDAGTVEEARTRFGFLVKATDSYLALMNRAVTSKVGEPFGYVASSPP